MPGTAGAKLSPALFAKAFMDRSNAWSGGANMTLLAWFVKEHSKDKGWNEVWECPRQDACEDEILVGSRRASSDESRIAAVAFDEAPVQVAQQEKLMQ